VNGNPNGHNAAPHFLIGVQAGDGMCDSGRRTVGVLVRCFKTVVFLSRSVSPCPPAPQVCVLFTGLGLSAN